VATFQFLNLNIDGGIALAIVDVENKSIFGKMTSNETTLQGLMKNESLFYHLSMKLENVVLPLNWWKTHEA
jgi:hypothetical protein